ncbi:hypothetical protein BHM03_00061856 [Ensete ventricosum]|nr:hypothetical protein BHM03_00061856 [Ensete ventricosum]
MPVVCCSQSSQQNNRYSTAPLAPFAVHLPARVGRTCSPAAAQPHEGRYIDGSLSYPPALIHVPGEPNPVPNSAYKLWLHQDRLILQAIQASVARSIAPLVSSYATAAEAWTK